MSKLKSSTREKLQTYAKTGLLSSQTSAALPKLED